MNDTIKNRLDAIDAQMADLQKEQAKLREELSDFVPGWYMMGDPDNRTPENRVAIDWVATEALYEWKKASCPGITPFTPELATRFFKKTRYDWSKAPDWAMSAVRNAPWADNPDRAVWLETKTPRADNEGGNWLCYCMGTDIPADAILDDSGSWRDSLEARPEVM